MSLRVIALSITVIAVGLGTYFFYLKPSEIQSNHFDWLSKQDFKTNDKSTKPIEHQGEAKVLDGLANFDSGVQIKGLSYSEHNPVLPLNMPIVPIRPVLKFGKPSSYSIKPALEHGLVFDKKTGIISGTPTQLGFRKIYTIQAEHASGNTSCHIELEVGQPKPIVAGADHAWLQTLSSLYVQNKAAGNYGDYYLNSDRRHSITKLQLHPQVSEINPAYQFGKVVIGNASLGVHGMYSLVRYNLMRNPSNTNRAFFDYRNNFHMWYPSVQDVHFSDRVAPDLSIAMFPYASMSFGKSHSEQDEMNKFFYTLAAFKPQVKETLKRHGLLIPTLQMIFRRTRVNSDIEYLSGKAHPSAFDDVENTEKMISMAQSITTQTIPPITNLRILSETYDNTGLNFHNDTFNSEHLFTTPHAIARVYRGPQPFKTMILDLSQSFDVNQRSLTAHLKVLRGNPDKIKIEKAHPNGMVYKITIPYHTTEFDSHTKRESNLVILGAFTHNGHHYSAPSFITSFSLNNENRQYLPDGRLTNIQYLSKVVEPRMSTQKLWANDQMLYDDSGKWSGWKRQIAGKVYTYNAQGLVVTEKNSSLKPMAAKLLSYKFDEKKKVLNIDPSQSKEVQYKYHDLNLPENGELDLFTLIPDRCMVLEFPKAGVLHLEKGHLIYRSQSKQADQFKVSYRTSEGVFISDITCKPKI